MYLTLYGMETGAGTLMDHAPFSWNRFCAAFAPLQVAKDPDRKTTHWTLEHPERPVRFYAPVSGLLRKTIPFVHFQYEDVANFIDQHGRPNHPFWKGIYELLSQWDCLLVIESIPMGKTIVVAHGDAVNRFPSWVHNTNCNIFVAEARAEFDQLIAEAWDLISRIAADSDQPRLAWADATDRDDQALTDYTNYLAGRRGKTPRYTWHGKPVQLLGHRGSFMERYGVWVDWRDFDDDIVNYFGERLREESLYGEETEHGLCITFGEATKELTLEHIGSEPYQTIRGVNEILSGAYEIRAVLKEMDGDTHCFLIAPLWLWRHLEEHDRERLEQKVVRIAANDGFRLPEDRGLRSSARD